MIIWNIIFLVFDFEKDPMLPVCTKWFNLKLYWLFEKIIIKTNNPLGKVAGWIPLFKIGGTISNVNVLINKVIVPIVKFTLRKHLKQILQSYSVFYN